MAAEAAMAAAMAGVPAAVPAPPAPVALAAPTMPGSGAMLMGHVKSWIEDRGMGFISPDDGGDDAFVHRSQLVDGVCLLVGSPVVFEDNWDPSKGKRVAKNVTGAAPADAKGAGKGAPAAPAEQPAMMTPGDAAQQMRGLPPSTIGQMLTGIVRTWKDERGMGFIAPANGGDDAFVHRSFLLDGQWLVVGSPVMFEDSWDTVKGKRIAKNVTGAVATEGKGAAGVVDPSYGGKGQAQPPPPPLPDASGMLPGTCKAWYDDRGMGFLQPATGGQDLFIHRSGLLNADMLTVGQQVLYEEGWDAAKGKKMAMKCMPATMGAALPAIAAGAAPGAAGPLMAGTVKAWVDERGMGFLVPDGGGEDIFVHRSNLVDGQWLQVGAHVYFENGWDANKGKHIARNVRGAAGGQPGVGADGMKTGTVKMWFQEKAFGFIIPDGGGDDVMVHKNEVAEGTELVQGMQVKYDAVWDPAKNKYKAKRCIPAHLAHLAIANGAAPAAPPSGGKGAFPPSDNLFVAGLPLGYTEDLIKQVFGQYGAVNSCRVLNNPGKPDLACMVQMADAGMAMWMVDNLNGNIPVGLSTPISVRFAQPVGYGKASGKSYSQNRASPYSAAVPALPAVPAPPAPVPAAPAPPAVGIQQGYPGMALDATMPAAAPVAAPQYLEAAQAAWPPAAPAPVAPAPEAAVAWQTAPQVPDAAMAPVLEQAPMAQAYAAPDTTMAQMQVAAAPAAAAVPQTTMAPAGQYEYGMEAMAAPTAAAPQVAMAPAAQYGMEAMAAPVAAVPAAQPAMALAAQYGMEAYGMEAQQPFQAAPPPPPAAA